MFAIKNVESGKYAKYTDETNSYLGCPWELVDEIDQAQQYKTLKHANEIAFWFLDMHKEWVLVNTETGEEHPKTLGKYLPA